jgi:hypothetical protein
MIVKVEGWIARRRRLRQYRDEVVVLGLIGTGTHDIAEMWRQSGMRSDRIYLALARLENREVVVSRWGVEARGYSRRRLYYLAGDRA